MPSAESPNSTTTRTTMRNFILGTFSALFLSFIAAGAQQVRLFFFHFQPFALPLIQVPQPPPPGIYYIVNSVSSPAGNKLAATYQVGQSNVIVTPLNKSEVQRVWLDISSHIFYCLSHWISQWIITLDEQFIPVTNQSVETTSYGNNVITKLKGAYAWSIENNPKLNPQPSPLFRIATRSQSWDLVNAANNANIVLRASTGSSTQRWEFILVE